MGILRTKVYKECYPFSREVLYDVEKRELVVHLLQNRKADLYAAALKARRSGGKIRKEAFLAIDNEIAKLNDAQSSIESAEYVNVDDTYMNWLLKRYRSGIRCFLGIQTYLPYKFYEIF